MRFRLAQFRVSPDFVSFINMTNEEVFSGHNAAGNRPIKSLGYQPALVVAENSALCREFGTLPYSKPKIPRL